MRPPVQADELILGESARGADIAGQTFQAERERFRGCRSMRAAGEALPARGRGGRIGLREEWGAVAERVRAPERGEHAEVAGVVAREEFVRTLAGKQHLHVLAGEFADFEHGEGGGIADRLVEVPGDALEVVQKVVGREFERVMLRADFAGRFRGPQRFGIRAAEADGERLHPPRLMVLRVGRDGAAVEAAAQEHADRHVGAQVLLHGVAERGVERLDGGIERGQIRLDRKRVTPELARPGGVHVGERHGQKAAGSEFMNVLEMRARRRQREPRDVVEKGLRVALAADPRERQEAFQFGGKGEASVGERVIERLLAEVIAGHEQAVLPRVEQRKGEHAAELFEHRLAVLLVEMHQHLGVRVGAENVAGGGELRGEFDVVVDLAVEDDADGPVFVPDRLPAALEVDDAQPPHAERQARCDMRARAVGAAMHDAREHPIEPRGGFIRR